MFIKLLNYNTISSCIQAKLHIVMKSMYEWFLNVSAYQCYLRIFKKYQSPNHTFTKQIAMPLEGTQGHFRSPYKLIILYMLSYLVVQFSELNFSSGL